MSREAVVKKDESALDQTLRPSRWDEYVGQEKIKHNLQIIIEAAKKRKEPIEHILLYGPAGLGKTTLAHLISKETNSSIRITSGPILKKVGDLAALLTNLEEGDILFIDEAHRLNKNIEEVLYPAMEDGVLDIILGKGPSARTLQLTLPKFTIIAATTKVGALSSPLRSRFGATYRLEFYQKEEIKKIITRSAKLLNVEIEPDGAEVIALASRSTPRVANRVLKRVRDYTQVKNQKTITEKLTREALTIIGIDEIGLEAADIRILETIIKKYNGGPVGLKTIAAATAEEIETIEDLYEPYLLQAGFLCRSLKGRMATKHAYAHLGIPFPKYQEEHQETLL